MASMLTSMSATGEDYDTPILPGGAPTDYERYLNTEELLGLQKGPGSGCTATSSSFRSSTSRRSCG